MSESTGSDEREADGGSLGSRIRAARRDLELTQAQLAENVGVSRRTVQLWESGRARPTRYLGRLARGLGRSESWIEHGVEGEEPLVLDLTEPELRAACALVNAVPGVRRDLVRKLNNALVELEASGEKVYRFYIAVPPKR